MPNQFEVPINDDYSRLLVALDDYFLDKSQPIDERIGAVDGVLDYLKATVSRLSVERVLAHLDEALKQRQAEQNAQED